MANVDPDLSSDCHAKGSCGIVFWAILGEVYFSLCGHCAAKHADALVARGWTLVPLQKEAG